jgi:pyruvate/2-oxoglutarate dehydrogenase complex dihydrolipoamide acyltransferase (E2) component
MVQLTIPDLGEGIDQVQVVAWHAKEGDRVRRDDDIVELVTDKAVFNVPAPADGILKKIKVPAGEDAPIGAVLGLIE